MWALSEAYVLLGLRSYPEWFWKALKWRPTHSSWRTSSSKWHDIFSPTTISFLIPFPSISPFHICFCLFFSYLLFSVLGSLLWVWCIIWEAMTTIDVYLVPIWIPQLHLIFTISCFSSLPLWSEHSHLLNHLVKFVFNENLP